MERTGYYKGKPFTAYVGEVEALKRSGHLDDAAQLLTDLLDVIEADGDQGVAPWYYEQLATVYRKQKRFGDELAVLERFARQKHAIGAKVKKLLQRLDKVRNEVQRGRTHQPAMPNYVHDWRSDLGESLADRPDLLPFVSAIVEDFSKSLPPDPYRDGLQESHLGTTVRNVIREAQRLQEETDNPVEHEEFREAIEKRLEEQEPDPEVRREIMESMFGTDSRESVVSELASNSDLLKSFRQFFPMLQSTDAGRAVEPLLLEAEREAAVREDTSGD